MPQFELEETCNTCGKPLVQMFKIMNVGSFAGYEKIHIGGPRCVTEGCPGPKQK